MWIFQEILHNCLNNNLIEALDSLFVLNQFIAVSYSFCRFFESYVKSLLPTYVVLSSVKFANSASLMS